MEHETQELVKRTISKPSVYGLFNAFGTLIILSVFTASISLATTVIVPNNNGGYTLITVDDAVTPPPEPDKPINDTGGKPRVFITTDIGNDYDDIISLVHYLSHSKRFIHEGISYSNYGLGDISDNKTAIDRVISAYCIDNDKLGSDFPSCNDIKDKVYKGTSNSGRFTSASQAPSEVSAGAIAIRDAALKDKTKPLYVLVWGPLTEVAQAINAYPEIKPYIRVWSYTRHNSAPDPNGSSGNAVGRDSKSWEFLNNKHKDTWMVDNYFAAQAFWEGVSGGTDDVSFCLGSSSTPVTDGGKWMNDKIYSHGEMGALLNSYSRKSTNTRVCGGGRPGPRPMDFDDSGSTFYVMSYAECRNDPSIIAKSPSGHPCYMGGFKKRSGFDYWWQDTSRSNPQKYTDAYHNHDDYRGELQNKWAAEVENL